MECREGREWMECREGREWMECREGREWRGWSAERVGSGGDEP